MKNNNQLSAWLFLLPSITFFLLFSAYPIFKSIQLSFYDAGVMTQKFIGLKNYITIFQSDRIMHSFINTGKFTLLIVPVVTFLPLVIAAIGYRMHKALQTTIRFAYYIPVISAGPVVTMIWIWMLNPSGILNQILGTNILWLGSNPEAFFAVSLVVISVDLGMTIIIYSAAMTTIDTELYDAAKIDGCNNRQEDWYITMPLMITTIGFIFFIKIVAISQIFLYPLLITGGGPNYGTNTAVLEIYMQAFSYGKYGFASAIGVLFAIALGTVGFLQRKIFKER